MKPQFINAKVVSTNTRIEDYTREQGKRGQHDFVMSRGQLMEFDCCPIRWLQGVENVETKSTQWGSLIDCLALQPHLFHEQFAVAPALYTDVGMQCPICKSITDSKKCKSCKVERVPVDVSKEWNRNADHCKDWESSQHGKTILKADEFAQAQQAILRLRADEAIAALLDESENQVLVTAEYVDRFTGIVVPMKALIDVVPKYYGGSLADLKTTDSAEPSNWKRHVFNFNYDVQAALYLDMFNAATGEERDTFRHIIQESSAPWTTARRIVSQEFLNLGRIAYQTALATYCMCLKTGEWPDYDSHARNNLDGWTFCEPEDWMVAKRQSVIFDANLTQSDSKTETEPDEIGIIP